MSDDTPLEDVDMADESDEPLAGPPVENPSDNTSVASVVDSTEELEIATDDESDQDEPLESSGSTVQDVVQEEDEVVEEQDTEPITEEQESPQPDVADEEVLQSEPDSPKGTDQEPDELPTESIQNEQDLTEGDNAAEASLPTVIPEPESEEREEMTHTPELPLNTTDDSQNDDSENVPTLIVPEETFSSSDRGEELSTCIRERDEATLTADELARQLRRREEEMERVLAENCTLSNQLNAAVAAKCEAVLQAQNVASQELMLQHKEKCLEQQMEMLHSHNAQLVEQLRKQGLELADLRHSSESRLLQLERQLELKTDDLRSCEESSNYQKEKLSESERRVEALLDKLRGARDSEISLQEIHSQEIQAQTRLAQLYEQESNDARALTEQLSSAVTELQATLHEASDKFGELETNAEREKIHLSNQIEVRDRKIAALEQELKSANVLLAQSSEDTMEQQVGALAPAAAVARKLVQSGLTLTQVYAQYAASIEELESRNAECKQLRDSLNTIIKQLEEKAPQLAEDRETLVRVQQENERLLADHDSALRKCDEIKAEAQQERKRACRLERDNERLGTMINDLSKQITVLVREVEARKHGCAPPSLNLSNSYQSYPGHNASQVLTARLLPFRDVDELQKRNLELLAVVRELSNKAEAEEKAESEGKDLVGLMSKLDDAMQQLSDLQERESHHASLMDQLVQQRDHYRELALQSGVRQTQEIALSPMKFDPSSPVKRMQAAEEKEWVSKAKRAEDALKKLQQQYEEFQKQSALKASRDAGELEKLKSELQESSVIKSKLSAVCEHKSGKLTSLETKVEELSKRLEAESKKTKAKGEESEKLHKMVVDLQREISVHRSMLVESKTTLASLDSELKRCRYSEMTLKQQCQNYERSFADRASICASIEEMKAALERSTGESNTILIKQLDEARLESRGLAKRLEEESARLGGELAELQRALDTERAAVIQAENKTKQANDEVSRVAERLIQAERDVLALRAHRNPNVDTAAQTELCVSEEVLREKRTAQRAMELEQQVTQLKSELLRTETKANQLSSIVNTSEIALQHSKAQAEKQSAEAAERLNKAQEEISALQAKLLALETQLAESRQNLEAAAVSAKAQSEEVRLQLTKAQRSEQQAREAEEACQALQSALDAAENEARVANEALALEVQKHVEHSKLCSDLEQRLSSEQEACKLLSQELEQCKQALAAVETRAAEREAELSKAAEVREHEARDLQGQNSALLDQVQLLGAELCALRQQQQQSSNKSVSASPVKLDLSSSFSSEETTSVEQLLQVLRYLRSERNAAITNAETLALQKAELQAQLETVKKQLQDAVLQSSELQPGASEATMRSRYEELIRRVELTSALSESSLRQREVATTLRQENETLQTRIAALTQQQEKASTDLRKALEQVETLQVELTSVRGEAGRWRTCANQLTERASRANPEELKRLLQERENLQRQLASEREELRKARVSAVERDNELVRLKGELAQAQEQAKSLQGEIEGATAKLNEKETQLKDIINKELQVRRIAKKYKTQFEELTKSVEEERASKQEAGAQAQDLTEERVAASEARAAAAEARLTETESNIAAAETRASDAQKQVALLESKVQELQQQFESKCQELEALRKEYNSLVDKSERARQVLDSARNRIRQQNTECNTLKEENVGLKQSLTEAQGVNAELQSKLLAAEQNREEDAVMKVALATQFEGKIARLERELNEAQHQQQISRPETQGAKNVASASDKSGGETPTANIRPMPGHSQAKAQQSHQSATVPPTSRSAPMARLRPMSMGPRSVAVAPSQQQTAAISGASGVGTVAVAPMQGVQSTSEASTSARPAAAAASVAPSGREEAAVEPSTSQQENSAEEQAPVSAGATVVLVRPQEVQPAVSSSQSLQSVTAPPSTSRPPPTLKRSRDEVATRSEEPQPKQGRMEVTSASTVEEEEPTSSLHETVDEIILVDSGDDTEEEEGVRDEADDEVEVEGTDYPEYEGDQADSEEEEEEEGDMEDGFERDDEELMREPEVVEPDDSDMEEESVEDEEEEDDEEDEDNEDEPCEDAEQPAQVAAEADDDDNEVVILADEPPPLPKELAALVAPEPTSSGQVTAVQSPEQQPAPQEVTDDVVSTPAASSGAEAQQEAADEEIMVPQTQEAASQECVSEDVAEVVDQPTSSDAVPVTLAADQEINLQSSQSVESPGNGSNPGSQQSSPFIGVSRGASPGRGMNRARRSGGPRNRPSSRPTPIVWDHGQSSHPQGMARGMPERGGLLPGRRARGPRPGFPPYGRHFPR